jgi:hypothetical protein
MALPRIVPAIDYLREASSTSLQSFELARLNHAANLRREIGALMDQWIQETSEALLARRMLEQRDSIRASEQTDPDLFQTFLESSPPSNPISQPAPSQIVPAPPRFSDSRRPLTRPADRKQQKQRSTA